MSKPTVVIDITTSTGVAPLSVLTDNLEEECVFGDLVVFPTSENPEQHPDESDIVRSMLARMDDGDIEAILREYVSHDLAAEIVEEARDEVPSDVGL